MSRRYDSYYPPYVSVAEKKYKNAKMLDKLSKAGTTLQPVVISGRKIVQQFWGKAWCDNVESYQDYENRLPRGRSYLRAGAVIDLQITTGKIEALVVGSASQPYKILIEIKPLAKERWETLKKKCLGKITSLLALVQGKLPPDILAEFCNRESGLFPAPKEITTKCSCPDWADLCKHLAAVFYGIGVRLDEDPRLFFTLRNIQESELIGSEVIDTLTDGVSSEIADDSLTDVFGVEFDTLEDTVADQTSSKKTRASTSKTAAAKKPAPAKAKKTPVSVSKKPSPAKAKKTPVSISKKPSPAAATKPSSAAVSYSAEKIKALRKSLGLTQSAFGELCDCSPTMVSLWESGSFPVSERFQGKLAGLFAQQSLPASKPKSGKTTPVVGLAEIRLQLGLSRAALGECLGVSANVIYNWERETTPIPIDKERQIRKLVLQHKNKRR